MYVIMGYSLFIYLCCLIYSVVLYVFFFYCYGHHRDLHVLTHSFPTRRSSDLSWPTNSLWVLMTLKAISHDITAWTMMNHHRRSEEHTSELQSLMRISYAVFCLKKKKRNITTDSRNNTDHHDNVLNIALTRHVYCEHLTTMIT